MMNRRALVGGVCATLPLVAICPRQSRAAEFSMKWGTALSASHPVALRCVEALNAIREETSGRVEIELFPNSQLGGDSDMLSQVRSGALEFLTSAGVSIGTFVRDAGIINMPFAFDSYDQIWPAVDGDFGALVRAAITKTGLHVFDRFWDNGFRQITTAARPVNGPDDLRGLKIRVPASPLNTALFRSLGASPLVLNVAEVYSALQTRVVDGQENPLAQVSLFKFYEVQKHCALTDHVWDGFILLANGPVWADLPKDLQAIVSRHIDAAALRQREDMAALNAMLRSRLEQQGMTFTVPEKPLFRRVLKETNFYTEWQGKYGPELWSLLTKYASALG